MSGKVKSTAKTVWLFGRFIYELIDELRTEDRQQKEAARRMMSERYREASNTAGREPKK